MNIRRRYMADILPLLFNQSINQSINLQKISYGQEHISENEKDGFS